MTRAKKVEGKALISFQDLSQEKVLQMLAYVTKEKKLLALAEYQIELLLQNRTYTSPVIAHGIYLSEASKKIFQNSQFHDIFTKLQTSGGIFLGSELAYKTRSFRDRVIKLISPAHTRAFFGDLPREMSILVSESVSTNVGEVDQFHAWLPVSHVQKLIRKRNLNRLRIFSETNYENLKTELEQKFAVKLHVKSWEQMNKTLVWALNLETTVMVFLFVVMTLLVALAITSGFLIFFENIRSEFVAFWILGLSTKKIDFFSSTLIHFMSFFVSSLGIAVGLIFLYFLDRYSPNIFPDIFVDRNIPVYITFRGIFLSFIIPYGIAVFFSFMALWQFKKGKRTYLRHIRTVGAD